MPEISVIVPVYKVEDYLPECIDSILAQSYEDFELILVDDGSPDRCGEICEDYARCDGRIRVYHQENQGLSGARNTGIDHAVGQFLTFVDSDDVVAPAYLKTLLETMERSGAEIGSSVSTDVTDGDISSYLNAGPHREKSEYVYDRRTALVELYRGNPLVIIGSAGKMYRRELMDELRFPVGRLHEDQYFTPMVFSKTRRIVFCYADLYYYRVRSGSITHQSFTAKRYDDLWAIDECISYFRARGEDEIVRAAEEKRMRLLCSYSIYAKHEGVPVPEAYAIGTRKALRYLRKHVSDDKYTYYLSLIHPKHVRPHAYFRKLKQLLGLRGSADTNKP